MTHEDDARLRGATADTAVQLFRVEAAHRKSALLVQRARLAVALADLMMNARKDSRSRTSH